METKETFADCCNPNSRRKKIILAFVIIAIGIVALVAAAGAKWKLSEARNRGNMMYGRSGDFGRGQMMGRGKGFYPMPIQISSNNQFVLPEDAAKNGEIAIAVNDLETAKKAVSDIAAKNKGNVYATFIAHVSNNVKNGSIVVQVPVENFDGAFGDLKKVGSQLVQESTQQIPVRNIYPMPLASTEKAVTDQAPAEETAPAVDSVPTSESKPEIAIYPNPAQFAQDKGYIEVVFADYGMNKGAAYVGQSVSNKIWVAFGLKLALLIALFVMLVVVLKRIFQKLRATKKAKPAVHIVRQMPKTHSRVVRIAKRK